MKVLLSALFIFSTVLASAQSLSLTSDTTTFIGSANVLMTGTARLTNIGSGSLEIKVKRTENNITAGHNSYFCWTGTCYPPNVGLSPNSIILHPGDYDTTLLADLNPTGIMGTSTVTYCFYDVDNESDSVCVTYTYFAGGVGITENNTQIGALYPNPADAYSKISYKHSGRNGKLVISNVLGKEVKEVTLPAQQTSVTINTSDLKTGVYFYSLIIDGKRGAAKKLIVSHR